MPENKNVVTVMRLTAGVAEKRIREIAQVSENVILGTHARERMIKRELFDVDVFRVLRQGHVMTRPN